MKPMASSSSMSATTTSSTSAPAYQSPLSTLSRSSKYRIPSPSSAITSNTTTSSSSGTSTDHSSSSRYSSPATTLSNDEKSDIMLDDYSDYDDEPVTQAPQLSALARMLLSESPKPAVKTHSQPPVPAPSSSLRHSMVPYANKPRQKLSWGTATEYSRKTTTTTTTTTTAAAAADDDGDARATSPNDDMSPSSASAGAYQMASSRDFVTPAPRPRTTRPFTGTSYYTSSSSMPAAAGMGDGYTEATSGGDRENITTHSTMMPESAVRPQLGSAARWKQAGRGLMAGLSGAPRRGAIRRDSGDQSDKDRGGDDQEPAVSYGGRSSVSPGGSPLQRAYRRQLQQEEEEGEGEEGEEGDEDHKHDGQSSAPSEVREYALSRSRGPTPDVQAARESWASRRTSFEKRTTPERISPEPMDIDRDRHGNNQSPASTPSLQQQQHQENVRPTYSRFSTARRAPSLSGSGSASSLRSNEPIPVVAASSSQPQSGIHHAAGQDKENMPPPSYRRSVTFPGKSMGPPPPRPASAAGASSSSYAVAHAKIETPPRSPTPSKSSAPKMGSLVRTPPLSQSPDSAPARRDVLANRDRNTPHRPAPPPPPPKMSMVNTATAAAGAQSSSRGRRGNVIINGRQYRRLDAIGKGGSSKVYKVMAENFRVFAMKKVTFNDEEDGQAAILGYKGEIELLKKLEKVERVIRLFDYEVNDAKGCLIMLMECGEADLAKLLQSHYAAENSTLDISFTRHYWREMLLCVQAVHALNIIHSDLKPANFLVVQGRLKLIDFGIANAIVGDTVNVHRESQVGTVNYMSPEALTDVNATPTGRAVQGVGANRLMKLGAPSDVWSLGCILYQMIYGRPPFSHLTSIYQKLAAIPNPRHEIAYPSTGIGDAKVPLSVIHTLQDCLERDKNDRATIDQLLSDENDFLNPDRRKQGVVEISEETLRRLLENAVDYTVRGEVPDKATIKAWAKSIYGKLEVQQNKRLSKGGGGGGSVMGPAGVAGERR